jgi:hypothetical protein
VVEPNFTRTQIKINAVFAAGSVADYDGMRGQAVATLLEHGMDSEEVARAVLWALQARNPKCRYPTGRNAVVYGDHGDGCRPTYAIGGYASRLGSIRRITLL